MEKNQRQHYRIKYPITERPVYFDSNIQKSFLIIDLSESGMRIILPDSASVIGPKSQLLGEITFHDKIKSTVSGHVIRITDNYIIIKFNQGVPLSRIMVEQRNLLRLFGNLEK